MGWASGIGAALSIGSSLAGTFGGLSANEDAKDAAREQAKLTYRNRMEEIRRQERENKIAVGQNKAAIGASNVQFSGSPMRYLDDMKAEMAQDINWRKKAASLESDAIRKGAPGGAADFATIAQGISGVGQTLLSYYR